MTFKRPTKLHSGIDMTPIIDVVFQLLAFFMLTSTYIKTSAINVDLPSSQTSDMQPVREAIVTLYQSGEIKLNDEIITMENLGIRIKDLYNENQDIVVTIRGDKKVPYQLIIQTMDTVRITGVQRLSLATTLKE